MSILKSNSFVPFSNVKLHYIISNDIVLSNSYDKVEEDSDKKYKTKEFKHLCDNCFLQKQDTVLSIIEDLREFDLYNGTRIFKNISYLNLYDLLYT